ASSCCTSSDGARARELDEDARAAAEAALDDEPALVQLDQRLGKRQAESGTFMASRPRGIDLAEWLQRELDLSLGHADAGIVDDELQPAILAAQAGDRDAAAARREFQRVRQEIEQDLLELDLIGEKARQTGDAGQVDLEADIALLGALADQPLAARHQRGKL